MAGIGLFLSAVGAGATGTGIAASSFIGPLAASQAAGVALGSSLGMIGTGFSALSALSSYQEGRGQADMYKATAAYNARASEIEAKASKAEASISASEERRKAGFLAGEAIAQGGKSGAIDPTTINIIGEIAGEGELRARRKMFEGDEQARGIKTGSDLDTWEAVNKARSARRQGISSALSTGASALKGLKGK